MISNNKSCLIIRNAYSYDFGGGEKFPVNLAVQLKKYDYAPIIVSRSAKLLEFAEQSGVTNARGWWWSRQYWSGVYTILFPIYIAWQFLLMFHYLMLIAKYNPEVVHPQSRDDFIAATFAARLMNKTVAWTDHADLKYVYQNHRSIIKNPVGKLVYLASKFAHTVTLVSNSEFKHIQDSLGRTPPKNYRVVYNGVSNKKNKPTLRPQNDKQAIVFVATSRLVKEKGIRELIEAFNILSKTTEARLWLYGEGPDESYFKKLAALNTNIIFKGHSLNTESELTACDVFVHPSYHEGFSISIIEAAKAGLPIIACNVGGNPEIVQGGKNGILVEPKNSEELLKAMRELAHNSNNRKVFGQAAFKTYESNFIFENIVKNSFLKIYENRSPFKILFDANPMINGNKSGVGYYTFYLIAAIAERYPLDVELVGHYFNFMGQKKSLILPQLPNISYKQSRVIPGKLLSLTRKFHFQPPLELFFKQRADAALFTNFVSLPSIFHVPTFIVVHDMCFEDIPEYVAVKNRNFLHTFVPQSVKRARKVITISEFSKVSIQKHYGLSSSKILITPIPPVSQQYDHKSLSIIKGKYILFLGNLEPRKNIINLLKGYELLDESTQKEYALVLAGGVGWYFDETMNYLKKLLKSGLNIQQLGYVSDAERVSLYENAELFVMASHYEGFGMPILEAMSFGIPTVVSDIPVFKEVSGTASLYFNKDEPSSIAATLVTGLKDVSIRKKLITKGYDVATEYSWDQIAEKVYNALGATSK